MSEPIQTSSLLNGLMEGPKKAPPPPGPRETNRAGAPPSVRTGTARVAISDTTIAYVTAHWPERTPLGLGVACMGKPEAVTSRLNISILKGRKVADPHPEFALCSRLG